MHLLYAFRMRKSRLVKIGVCEASELYDLWDNGVEWHLDISAPKILQFENSGQAREKFRHVVETCENKMTPEGLYRTNRKFEDWIDNKFIDAGRYLIKGQIEHADEVREGLGETSTAIFPDKYSKVEEF